MLIGFSFFMIIRKSTRCITAIKELDFGLIVQVAYIKIELTHSNECGLFFNIA